MSRVGTTANGRKSSMNEIKPSDVYELKRKTQHLQLKTRQMKTQLSRLNDKIVSQTNAINKTFEQNSDTPAVATNHANTIPQLARSVESMENTLEALNNEIEQTRNDDKTFAVKELQEEVKLQYCEYMRLNQEFQKGKNKSQDLDRARADAEIKCSNQHYQELRAQNRELREQIRSLDDKSKAYGMKKAKLQVDSNISEQTKQKTSSKQIVDEAHKKQEDAEKESDELVEKLNKDHEEHVKNVEELRKIIADMRQAIIDRLNDNDFVLEEEEDVSDDDNNEEKKDDSEKDD